MRILLVEDDRMLGDGVQAGLGAAGFTVDWVRDGEAALAALAASRSGLAALPVAAFPAVAHATLARRYARGASPSDLEKRLRLLMAVLTGRIG